ncbi:MAG: SDR family NAD(P)-dependent oxidoreductase, partial [Verrucomicrobia subdivision 3 bacterium]|nr:SDR family NAD(P)-dependent oxidoreductase [Limisphaerales bacterium]
MEKPLSGKVALVSGATRLAGLGAAIADALARAGADIGLGYFRAYDRQQPWGVKDSEPQELLAQLRHLGVRAVGFEVDLSRPEGPAELFACVQEALGPIHILVNNAAYSTAVPIEQLTAEALDQHYTVNLRATALLCAEFVRRYPSASGGRIINLTSGQGAVPMPTELAYAATKGAIDALTVSLSVAVAGKGITVNAVDPGPTDTGWMSRELYEALLAKAPMGRLGTP